ncbi:MAG: arylsulfatase [Paenibacillaceae bacterium]|jgi:arylsulfatase A-like enzyme|nr:arylsulfatase [Paenibacillaceae bacterium]
MDQPNIVFITCDQLRGDHLGCAGHPIIQTPHIDLLAKRGIRFARAISTTPVCIPARAMIMTGMEGYRLGNTGGKPGYRLPVRETLPQLLSDAGYETRAIGKMHVYPERCHYGFHSMQLWEEGRLFGQTTGEHRGYGDYEEWLAEQGYSGQAFAHGMANNEYGMAPWHLPDYLHPSEWIGFETCKAIKRRDWTRPLFVWASFTAPHPPLVPLIRDLAIYEGVKEFPDPVIGDWTDNHPIYHEKKLAQFPDAAMGGLKRSLTLRAYYSLVTQIDRQLNRIIGTLREERMLENTWFIFASDHGDNLGDHGLWAKSNFLRGACGIPLIVTPPIRGDLDAWVGGEWMPGQVSEALVGLQDILPTCLELAGVMGAGVPEHVGSQSLLPLLRGDCAEVRERMLGEFGTPGSRSLMLTDGKWKYIWFEQDGVELLFDLEQDQDELHNLAGRRSDVLTRWREELAARLSARGDDPAVEGGRLKPVAPGSKLAPLKRARLVNDLLPRGLH